MIKVLHTADWHIGWENYSRTVPGEGLSSCLQAFRRTVRYIVELAKEQDVDLVAIPGDLYKMRDPSQTYQAIVAGAIKRLSDAGIAVAISAGNHDLPGSEAKASTIRLFEALGVPKVVCFEKPEIVDIETKRGVIQVAAIPWLRKTEVDASSLEEIAKKLTEKYLHWIETLAGEVQPGAPAILMAHLTASLTAGGTEQAMVLGADPIIPMPALANPKFDAVMLGHLHRPQLRPRGAGPAVAYCGSPQRLDFSDEGEGKGCYIWTFKEPTDIKAAFHPLPAREFVTVTADVVEGGQIVPGQDMLQALLNQKPESIVRVNLTVPEHLVAQANYESIYKTFSEVGASWVQINKKILREHSLDEDESASIAGLTPLAALETYCQAKGKPEERTKVLVSIAKEMIQSETANLLV